MTIRSAITFAAAVGGALTGNPFLAAAATAAGAVVGGIIDPVKVKQGAPLEDNLPSTTAVGRVLPVVYGTYPIDRPFWLYALPFNQEKSKKRSGLFTKVTEIKNLGTWSRGICEGFGVVLKCWYGDELVYDVTNASGPAISDSIVTKGGTGVFAFTRGGETEVPGVHEEALFGLDIPGYRGIVREVVNDIFVDRWGGRPLAKYLVATELEDAFPHVDFDETELPGGGTSSGIQHHYNDGRHWVVIDNLVIRLFDNGNFARVRSHELGFTLGQQAVSPFDNNIYGDRDIFATAEYYRIDPETFQLLSRTDDAGTDSFTHGFTRIGGTSDHQVLFINKDSTLRIYEPDDLLGPPVTDSFDPNGVLPVMLRANTIVWSDFLEGTVQPNAFGPGNFTGNAAIDGEGDLWTVLLSTSVNVPNDWLVRVSGATLDVVDLIEVPSVPSGAIDRLGWDPGTNSLYGGSEAAGDVWKYDIEAQSWTQWNPGVGLDMSNSQFRNRPTNSALYFKTGQTTILKLDLTTMTTVETFDVNSWNPPGTDNNYNALSYDSFNDAIITSNGTFVVWLLLNRKGGSDTSVKLVTEDLATRLGLSTTEDVDASAGELQSFPGYIIDSQQPAANDVAEVATLFFDAVRPHDGMIQVVDRALNTPINLSPDLLGAHPREDSPIPPFQESEPQERERIPAQFVLNYRDPDKDYEVLNQSKRRDDRSIATERPETLTTKAALSAQQAIDWVTRMEGLARAGRKDYELPTTWANLTVEPGDVVEWLDDGRTLSAFIESTELGREGVYRLKGRSEDLGVFGMTGEPVPHGGGQDSITVHAATCFNVLDVPHVQLGLQNLVLHVVAGPTSDLPWRGHEILEAPSGLDFEPMVNVDPTEAVQGGFLTTILDVGPMHVWDRANSATIRLMSGTLAAATETQVLALNSAGVPANGLWIEADDGTWEVVQFTGVADNGDGTWTIGGSNGPLLRGMHNSEEAMNAGHAVGRRVYVIPQSSLIAQEVPTVWLGLARGFIGVDPDSEVQSAVRKFAALRGCSLKPYPVLEIEGSVSSQNWVVTFRRQGRNTGPSNSLSDVPTGVTVMDFIARVYDGATLKRSITTTASAGGSVITVSASDPGGEQSLVYTAADQDTDFGGSSAPLASLDIEIVQIEENGIEGPPRRVTLTQ